LRLRNTIVLRKPPSIPAIRRGMPAKMENCFPAKANDEMIDDAI
jgi:hypothetical protein